jgi:hypothetical protein
MNRNPRRLQTPRPARDLLVRPAVSLVGCLLCICGAGCFGFGQEQPSAPVRGVQPGQFVATGTMVDAGFVVPCPVFERDNGVKHHLVRAEDVPESDFAALTTLGTRSTLEVVLRRDLDQRCQADDVLEVLEVTAVLEINAP